MDYTLKPKKCERYGCNQFQLIEGTFSLFYVELDSYGHNGKIRLHPHAENRGNVRNFGPLSHTQLYETYLNPL